MQSSWKKKFKITSAAAVCEQKKPNSIVNYKAEVPGLGRILSNFRILLSPWVADSNKSLLLSWLRDRGGGMHFPVHWRKRVFMPTSGTSLSKELWGELNHKEREKGSEQIVCECLNIRQCLGQRVNHVPGKESACFLTGTDHACSAMRVCTPSAEVWMESQPCPQGFDWHGDKHLEETGSLTPSKLWMGWKAAGNPAQFLCWKALRKGEVMGNAMPQQKQRSTVGRCQEPPRKKLPTFRNQADARVMDIPEECEMWRCADVL